MKKYFPVLLLFFLCLPLLGQKVVLFERPEHGARHLVIEDSCLSDTGKEVRQVFTFHPLCRIYRFREMLLPNGVKGYQRSDIVCRDGKTPVRHAGFPLSRAIGCGICAVLILFLLFRRIYLHANQMELMFIPPLLRILLCLVRVETDVFPTATDEPGYFKTISDMLKGVWHEPWSFTVGTGFFYLPFILLAGAKDYFDLVPYFSYFSALFLAPCVLILGFLILRKLQVSCKTACFLMLLWSVYPLLSLHFEDWNTLSFQQFFHYPWQYDRFFWHFYYSFCINSGFNAMSDMPGLFLVTGMLYLLLAMPSKVRYAALAGAIYGFACLVRINYILLAPLFAYILWSKFEFKRFVAASAASVGAFFCIFAVQLVCNTIQFGSPLTFCYVLHYTQNAAAERPDAGFTWHTFSQWRHLKYLFKVNLPVFALGTAALWVMRDRFKQTVLILLSVPVVLFFCGYSHTFCDARRFIFPAFAGLLMAAGGGCDEELSYRDRVCMIFSLAAMVLLTVPADAHWKGLPFMLGQGILFRTAGILVPLMLFGTVWGFIRKKFYRTAVFVFLAALFFYAPVGAAATGMFLLLPFALARNIMPEKFLRHFKSWQNNQ